jgi:CRP-like cAMP-binding protein
VNNQDAAERLIAKLATRSDIDTTDCAAIRALPFTKRTVEAPAYLVREGEKSRAHCTLILSGFAMRQKLAMSGARQIVSFHLAGDFIDLQQMLLSVADHNVQALTRMTVADVPRAALHDLSRLRPNIARAMWIDGLVDASIYREWVLNVGRRDARAKIAHVLCEFGVRMKAAGIAHEGGYELPMTQEQLGDAVGLTAVHVNRTLKALVADGLVSIERRQVRVRNWDRLMSAGDFSALYLHLDQVPAVAR